MQREMESTESPLERLLSARVAAAEELNQLQVEAAHTGIRGESVVDFLVEHPFSKRTQDFLEHLEAEGLDVSQVMLAFESLREAHTAAANAGIVCAECGGLVPCA